MEDAERCDIKEYNYLDYIDLITGSHSFNDLNAVDCPVMEYLHSCCGNDTHGVDMEVVLHKWIYTYFTDICDSVNKQIELVKCGISFLKLFVQENWTGPPLTCDKSLLTDVMDKMDDARVLSALTLDGEGCSPVVKQPALLLIARVILQVCNDVLHNIPCVKWWFLRCLFTHQQILEEFSTMIHDSLMLLIDQLTCSDIPILEQRNLMLLHLEALQINLYYTQVSRSKKHLETVLSLGKIQLELVGALGKRTHFQERDLPQLMLHVNIDRDENISVHDENKGNFPKDLPLNDEVRLNHIKFANDDDGKFPVLQPLEQAVVLGHLFYLYVSQPKDNLAEDELRPYYNCILSHPQSWCLQMSALLFRCRAESNSSRTVERAMLQVESLIDNINMKEPCAADRLEYYFVSYLAPRWKAESQLASLLLSLGCVNSALDVYLRIQQWEDVISCYNILQLRHKAEEIIRQELSKKESVKLWCLLGDATDDVSCYEKAWDLSEHRSGRAQRHWGMYYFTRKQYGNSIPHLQKSLEINSLQTTLWFRLGFACLDQENWELAATAYRRCCSLDTDNFEAWNNLAKAYVKLGQKARAWKALQEAVKCNYENWRVWENLMLVSIDCGEFEEVIRSYHRILDLKEKHIDGDVLRILVDAIVNNVADNGGIPASRHRTAALQLFGRLTAKISSESTLWHQYARLTGSTEDKSSVTLHKTVQFFQKAYQAAVRSGNWVHDIQSCINVMNLCVDLADASLEFTKNSKSPAECIQVLSSAKLSLNGTVTKIKSEYTDVISQSTANNVTPDLHRVEQKLQQIVDEIRELQTAST